MLYRKTKIPVISMILRITKLSRKFVEFISGLSLLILLFTIVASIVIRSFHYDNSWSFDGTLYSLQWLAFVGAAYTAYRGGHITSGISLENIFPKLHGILSTFRYMIMIIPIIGFIVIGFQQTINSFMDNEALLDTLAWPVWIARLSIPIGMIFWLLATVQSLFGGEEKELNK